MNSDKLITAYILFAEVRDLAGTVIAKSLPPPLPREDRRQRGASLLELIIAIGIGSLILSGLSWLLIGTSARVYNEKQQMSVDTEAIELLNLLCREISIAGAGMPLGQSQFVPTILSLGDAPEAVVSASSTTSSLVIRLSTSGENSTLSADFTPTLTARSFYVTSISPFALGQSVYISGASTGGNYGLQGVITKITNKEITLGSTYRAVGGATFSIGSVVAPVQTVVYNSPNNWSGVTRDDGRGVLLLLANSQFSLRYLNSSGNPIPLPLSATNIASDLAGIEVTVTVQSTQTLKNSENQHYQVQLSRVAALRNLIINR